MQVQNLVNTLWRSKLILSLVILFFAASLISPVDSDGSRIFLESGNLLNILRQVSITGILAVGMTLVILTGGIDLAVGSVMAFGATLCAMLLTLGESHNGLWVSGLGLGTVAGLLISALIMAVLFPKKTSKASQPPSRALTISIPIILVIVCVSVAVYYFFQQQNNAPILIILLAVISSCALLGGISGLLVSKGKLQAFIATLAMMVATLGLARLMAGQDQSVFPIYSGINVSESFDVLRQPVWGVPVPGLIFLSVVVIFTIFLNRLRIGRYIYAVGGNERAAFLSGIPVDSVKTWVYALSGALSGLAGILYCAQYQQGKPDAGAGMELDAIAAVVIGGANLMGGKGSINGTLIGVLIFGVLSNILQLNNVDSNTQLVLKGLIIVVAVLVQQFDWQKLLTMFETKKKSKE